MPTSATEVTKTPPPQDQPLTSSSASAMATGSAARQRRTPAPFLDKDATRARSRRRLDVRGRLRLWRARRRRAMPNDAGAWTVSRRPILSYRSGFEVRTTRLCRRVLMFHHFASRAGVEQDCLVRSTDSFIPPSRSANVRNPVYTLLRAITPIGYRRKPAAYANAACRQSSSRIHRARSSRRRSRKSTSESLENLPIGVDGAHTAGSISTARASPASSPSRPAPGTTSATAVQSSEQRTKFAPLEPSRPSPISALAGGQATVHGPRRRRSARSRGAGRPHARLLRTRRREGWQSFRPFTSRLNRDTRDPNLKFVDLDGDGHADVLITEDDAFAWHASLAEEGFGPAQRVAQALDEEQGPRLVFADAHSPSIWPT